MCYTDEARPPLPPVGGAASDSGDLRLQARDGNQFDAFFARAERPTGAGRAQSWRQSAANPDLAGCVGFYGVPARVRDLIPEMKAPLLLLIAGDDFTPQEEFQRFDQELSAARVPHKMHVYPDAPHSFF